MEHYPLHVREPFNKAFDLLALGHVEMNSTSSSANQMVEGNRGRMEAGKRADFNKCEYPIDNNN